jgi:GT2 family glycosyltransferase
MDLCNLFCRATGLTGIFRNSPLFNSEAYGGWDRMSEREVDIVTGCLFLISRKDWESLGGFDPTFFMYAEEADLCLRARTVIHARPRVTPEVVIVHHGGASETVKADKMVRLLRAKRELIRRHFPAWQQPIAKALFDVVPATRSLAFTVIARLGRRSTAMESAGVWTEIWKRRTEWRTAET